MCRMSESSTSVPIDISAVSLTRRARSSSGSRVSVSATDCASASIDVVRKLARMPTSTTTLAYLRLSLSNPASSGKCQPYHSFARIAYVFTSLSRSSSNPTACTTIVSTLSGENLSLYRDSECDKPSRMAREPNACSLAAVVVTSPSPLQRSRAPRSASLTSWFCTTAMPSFSLIAEPSFASATPSSAPGAALTTCFDRNLRSPLPTFDSTSSVAAVTASEVSLNAANAFSLSVDAADSPENAAHSSSGAFFWSLADCRTSNSAWPPAVSNRSNMGPVA
mmetsp:Transcript_25885/g.103477  ORF Transcript_25885/g.103477 Transcript_25885/m.103477 type:complete len:279 (-) Transcript_25885:44-880(-)